MPPYEWWCPRCRVTHPPGRKQCLHCGGPVQTSRDPAPAVFDPRAILEGRLRGPAPDGAPPPADAEEAEAAPESRSARGARIGMTVVWIALAIGASLLRMCQEQG